jgi:hypothetical protein
MSMRTTNWPIWAALILALSLPSAAAKAADEFSPRCPAPVSSAITALMLSAPDAVVFEFRGHDATVGIKIFNALPPIGHEVGDRFYIAVRPAFPLSRLIVAKHGCVANAMLVDLRVAIAIRKAIKHAAPPPMAL